MEGKRWQAMVWLWKVPSFVTGDWGTQVQSAPKVKCCEVPRKKSAIMSFHSDSTCLPWILQPFKKSTPPPQNRNGVWVILKGALPNPSTSLAQIVVLIRGKIQQLLHRKENWTIGQCCMLCFLNHTYSVWQSYFRVPTENSERTVFH